jgi:hypothetical protein
MTHEIKKVMMMMRNKEKILKQNSLRSGINIKFGLFFVETVAVVGLIYAFGVPFPAIVVLYSGYKLLRLTMRFIGLVLSLVFTLVSIFIIIAIILLLIF